MNSPHTSMRSGGIAALIAAATNLLGMAVFVILLAPKGLGADDDPSHVVALLADNQAAMRLWYLIIFLAFGVCLILLSVALHERLKAGSPPLAQAVAVVGLIWAALVIVVGALSITDLSTVVSLYGESPSQAAAVWLTLDAVETGLGGGGGETIVSALWLMLLSWAALRTRNLPSLLNYLGAVTGVAGIVSVLAWADLTAVYGIGLIVWFVWLGMAMLRTDRRPERSRVPTAKRA